MFQKSFISICAPFASNSRTTSSCPCSAALCSAVVSLSSFGLIRFTSTRCSSSTRTTSSCPYLAAWTRGVSCFRFCRSMCAP
ncbi:hypothetical protein BDV24DRAFT_139001 [Aspergillus arachidicola]|uniref:Uncharacterized protein n=1 Tax=Aspergillus arachidicola TaxID=656916 RepID=A0A5N6Y0I0_9EURO|nr:hypothetical protein BDV24DRAFT_139001 [Aspergillus arachidicola]